MEENNIQNEASHVNNLHQVTPLSKYLAMILFIALPFIGGWIGYQYAPEKVVEVEQVVVKNAPETTVSELTDERFFGESLEFFAYDIAPFQWNVGSVRQRVPYEEPEDYLTFDGGCHLAQSYACVEVEVSGTLYHLDPSSDVDPDEFEVWYGGYRGDPEKNGYMDQFDYAWIAGSDGLSSRQYDVYQKQVGEMVQTVTFLSQTSAGQNGREYNIFVSKPYAAPSPAPGNGVLEVYRDIWSDTFQFSYPAGYTIEWPNEVFEGEPARDTVSVYNETDGLIITVNARERVGGNRCYLGLCETEGISSEVINGITWQKLDTSECVGGCEAIDTIYRTTHDDGRYYIVVWEESDFSHRVVLESFWWVL